MNKDFRVNKIIKEHIINVEIVKGMKLVKKIIGKENMNWKDYNKEKPNFDKVKGTNESVYCLVELESDGENEYHIATFHPNIIIIGGQFHFDMPRIKRWILLEDILKEIK